MVRYDMKEKDKHERVLSSSRGKHERVYSGVCKENIKTFEDRIKVLIARVGNPNLFAIKTGVSVSGIKRYLNGGEPTISKLLLISNSLGINPNWLLTGEGDIIKSGVTNKLGNKRAIALLSNDSDTLSKMDEEGSREALKINDLYLGAKELFSCYSSKVQELIATALVTNNTISLETLELIKKEQQKVNLATTTNDVSVFLSLIELNNIPKLMEVIRHKGLDAIFGLLSKENTAIKTYSPQMLKIIEVISSLGDSELKEISALVESKKQDTYAGEKAQLKSNDKKSA